MAFTASITLPAETCHTEAVPAGLSWPVGLGVALGSATAFQLAFLIPALCGLIVVCLGGFFALRRSRGPRQAFYLGLLAGFGVFAPQMGFLWTIFNFAAIPLWLILACFHGLFALGIQRADVRWGSRTALLLAPVLWCGIEYFRSEVWWLRFSWFSAGTCLPGGGRGFLSVLGVYGVGAVAMLLGAMGCRWLELGRPAVSRPLAIGTAAGLLVLTAIGSLPLWARGAGSFPARSVQVAGAQLEFPGVPEVRFALARLRKTHPEAELIQLSEYTFDGTVPEPVKEWCRRERVWLLAGGRAPLPEIPEAPAAGSGSARLAPKWLAPSGGDAGRFRNTAFVVSPEGEVVFEQAKSRPIQFFRDGEPARERRVWESPWGRLGIAICYDASYRQVMDDLVRQGAQALLVPTMDVETWGAHQHRLNARMARLRSMEYGLPVFRVASSGISQLINANGCEIATAPFPGPGAEISGVLTLAPGRPRLPLDHWFAPMCSGAVLMIFGALAMPGTFPRRVGSLLHPNASA